MLVLLPTNLEDAVGISLRDYRILAGVDFYDIHVN